MFEKSVIDAFRSYAVTRYPEEACGFIVRNDDVAPGCTFVPVANIHPEPTKFFEIAAHDYILFADRLLAVLHTHPHQLDEAGEPTKEGPNNYPSVPDMVLQDQLAVPFGIALVNAEGCDEPFWFGDQCPIPPLLGRTWRHNVTDCYGAVRDYFRLGKEGCAAQGMVNPYKPYELPLEPREYEWWKKGQNLYLDAMERNGFKRIPDSEVRPGDVCLIKISKVPSHAAVCVGNNLIYHHTMLDLSSRVPISRWSPLVYLWGRLTTAELAE